MIALFLALAAPAPLSLNLICTGRSLVSAPVETTSVVVSGPYGGSAYGSGVRSQLVDAESSVGFRLEGDAATIRIPRHLLPDIRGGKAGWFNVKNLRVSDAEITGKAAINFLHNPSFRIDRVTGQMSTSGGNSFACKPDVATERKF